MKCNWKKSVTIFLFSILIMGLFCGFVSVQASTVKLNKKSLILYVGDKQQLKVTNTKEKVKWSSSKKKVATVSAKGKVTAKGEGNATITAKVSGKKYKCKVTVHETKMSADTITIKYGDSANLKLLYPKKKAVWFSSDTRIAFADGEKVLAKSVGEAVITAKCNGKSYFCKITVLSGEDDEISPNGIYTSKEKVAAYIHTYNKLPGNYITKAEAEALGWSGGSLLDYAPYKCIGGDVYSNYEKTLPVEQGRTYYECDINTLGALQRGVERIVYSNDGLIYYTSDHYTTFTLLYE